MTTSQLRRVALLYTLLLLLCGAGYARYAPYQLDGDAVAFMDLADAMRAHDWAHVVNGYWNPAYAAALAVGEAVAQPTRRDELQTFYWVNFAVFAGCVAACGYLVRGLALARERLEGEDDPFGLEPFALEPWALFLASLALMFASFQRELSLGAVRSDSLLLLFFLLAAGVLSRLQAGGRFALYPLLGLVLGLAYLTKSFAFLPAGAMLAGIVVHGATRRRGRIVAGALVAGLVFAAVAGPYIAAISKQRGRLTTGESARLNYAFLIDGMGRWHEWHTGEMGRATADFKHPEELLLERPAVYSYARHPVGTYPIWFDPSYWTDTVHPSFYLKGHVQRLARCTALLLRFVGGHLEAAVLLGVLLAAGCFWRLRRGSGALPLLVVPVWGALIFAIYFPIDLEDRYLTAGLLLVVLPLLATLRRSGRGYAGEAATAAALLLAGLVSADAISQLGELRRSLPQRDRPLSTGYLERGAYDPQIYAAASGLTELGVRPGQAVACLGSTACYVDQYWARLAGTAIRAEVEVPLFGEAGVFWEGVPDKDAVYGVLRRQGMAAVVGYFASSAHLPAGWRKLGTSNFYAYSLQ